MTISADPHGHSPVLAAGAPLADARLALVLLHGRGASPEDILGLGHELRLTDVACLAPRASNHSWYPKSFLSPLDENEPYLGSALGLIGRILEDLASQGFDSERVALLGFSQGACLSLEFAARHPRRFAAIVGLSGGLIGPPGSPRDYSGSLDGTPVFLGCSDIDAHIPVARVHESAAVLRRMGAAVDERIYPRMGHTVNRDEVDAVAALLGGTPAVR